MGESAGASVDGAIVGTRVGAHCRREDTIAEAVRDVLSEEGVGAIGRAVQERLCEDGITISERQAYRYVKRYREGGRKALEDARRLPRAKSFVSVDRRLFEIVEGELASQLHKSSGTRGRAIDRVRAYQIAFELNTKHPVTSAKGKTTQVADSPDLNGALRTLSKMLAAYHAEVITPSLWSFGLVR